MKHLLPALAAGFAAFVAALSCSSCSAAQAARTTEPADSIRPTVTKAMGDVGGTFFGRAPDPARTRHYYVAAESELWDFAPSGRDEVCGIPFPPPLIANRQSGKVRYIQYTDATFATKALPTPSLGILGPVLRGVVGDYLAITFFNRTTEPLSMHPHGVKYDKDSEGAHYQPGPGRGAAVGPGAKFTYIWHLDESSGPLPGEPSSKGWLYHSHVAGDQETNLGLVGAIIVTDPRRARPDGTPADVDRELATLFMIFNESGLDEAAIEAAEYAHLPGAQSAPLTWTEVQQLTEQGSRYAINGRIFGNLPGIELNEGDRTRWYLFALGSEQDFHTAHWHGLRVVEEGRRRTDVVELLPASMKTADMVADNPGTWLLHCHVAAHMREGMFAQLTIHARGTVGADRTPGRAFLGLPSALQSMQLDRAEIAADNALHLTGVATVFEGFSVFNQTIRVRLGETTVAFQPNQQGVATEAGGIFRIQNASEFGVVSGGLLRFEIALSGAEWRPQIEKISAMAAPVSLVMEIGSAHHIANAPLHDARKKP